MVQSYGVIKTCTGIVSVPLACRLWTENNLPSLKGSKTIDNRGYPQGTERARYVINIRPEPQLTSITNIGDAYVTIVL